MHWEMFIYWERFTALIYMGFIIIFTVISLTDSDQEASYRIDGFKLPRSVLVAIFFLTITLLQGLNVLFIVRNNPVGVFQLLLAVLGIPVIYFIIKKHCPIKKVSA